MTTGTKAEEEPKTNREVHHIKAKKGKVPVSNQEKVSKLKMRAYHCAACGRFLGYEAIVAGVVKNKCRACREWNILDITPEGALIINEKTEK